MLSPIGDLGVLLGLTMAPPLVFPPLLLLLARKLRAIGLTCLLISTTSSPMVMLRVLLLARNGLERCLVRNGLGRWVRFASDFGTVEFVPNERGPFVSVLPITRDWTLHCRVRI